MLFPLIAAAALAANQPAPVLYPTGASEAICKLHEQALNRGDATLINRAAEELRLTPQQKRELLIFCLGFERGRLAEVRKRP